MSVGKTSQKRAAWKRGIWAENLVALSLQFKGYSIIERRCKTPVGEIDLLVKKGDTIAAVEVKQRGSFDSALEAIHSKNRRRVERAALFWLSSHAQYANMTLRFDAAMVSFKWPYVRHLPNAWATS